MMTVDEVETSALRVLQLQLGAPEGCPLMSALHLRDKK
jgi:hypothetical protein